MFEELREKAKRKIKEIEGFKEKLASNSEEAKKKQ